ncbi:SDR family oxidoreductase [Paraburkholderia phenoliruptrix]|uniref:SDR family oxidoreductase n=1 Tax=Paraburkholderia phenoliruptrix TaxID=252970 RepID=UPI0028699CFA|nr:SDR family oxidoreductase [Paraburkholderia phenoliruptrix]WMY08287.1 SDR family oxidoreductase [Paraburkholderia phenoliruptrix]
MLKGKTALITGGASGIGLAAAKLMHANGARVVIAGRDADKLEAARREIGEEVHALQVDVLSRQSLVTMASKIKEALGGLDVFFANAGVAYVTPLATTTEDAYDTLMDTNVKSVFFSLQAMEPILRAGASVILNTAWLNQVGVPGRAALSASKAAVRSFARTFSAELLDRQIRVNAVSPGLIDTPILRGVGQSEHPGQTDAEFKKYLAGAAKLIPFGRLGRPDEIAAAVLFLASDASGYMLGSELVIDGGLAEL